ncbi:MAG: hypothetical protein KA792_08215, partial [Bacteroidales bacterium]|nr:hypothetical protein [Bacteroidales bacterium]
QLLKTSAKELTDEMKKILAANKIETPFEYNDKGDFTGELKFAGDMLIMNMHTNIFEFPRANPIFKTSYLNDDKMRSYSGVILLYNFLADSFKYKRYNDVGYLVARIFINKENHYFIEGKREIGSLYYNFETEIITKQALRKLLESAISYCIDFDLLLPPYDSIKEASVMEMQETTNNLNIKTGKRLGFMFQADQIELK